MLAEATRPLRRGLYSVVGVPNPEQLLDASLQSLVVGLGPRRIRREEDVLFVPFDGLVDRRGATLPDGNTLRQPARLIAEGVERVEPVAPAAVLDREALYLGRFNGHYGHFLVEAMARWWAVAHVPRKMPLLWLARPGLNIPAARERLAWLGIDEDRITFVTEPSWSAGCSCRMSCWKSCITSTSTRCCPSRRSATASPAHRA